MRFPISRAPSWCCFCIAMALATPVLAVNFELSSAMPVERLAVTTHAHVTTPTDDFEITEGIAGLADAAAYSEAFAQVGSEIAVFAYAGAGLITDIQLDSPTSAITLLTSEDSLARGDSHDIGNSYEASSSTLSAFDSFDKFNPVTVDWVIDVLPSAGETPGTPTRVHIDTFLEGLLTTVATSQANASWQIALNENTQVSVGSAAAGGGATLPFNTTASRDLMLALGSSFKLRFEWNLSVSGNDFGLSRAEYTAGGINLSAELVPEPCSLLLFGIGFLGFTMLRRLPPRL